MKQQLLAPLPRRTWPEGQPTEAELQQQHGDGEEEVATTGSMDKEVQQQQQREQQLLEGPGAAWQEQQQQHLKLNSTRRWQSLPQLPSTDATLHLHSPSSNRLSRSSSSSVPVLSAATQELLHQAVSSEMGAAVAAAMGVAVGEGGAAHCGFSVEKAVSLGSTDLLMAIDTILNSSSRSRSSNGGASQLGFTASPALPAPAAVASSVCRNVVSPHLHSPTLDRSATSMLIYGGIPCDLAQLLQEAAEGQGDLAVSKTASSSSSGSGDVSSSGSGAGSSSSGSRSAAESGMAVAPMTNSSSSCCSISTCSSHGSCSSPLIHFEDSIAVAAAAAVGVVGPHTSHHHHEQLLLLEGAEYGLGLNQQVSVEGCGLGLTLVPGSSDAHLSGVHCDQGLQATSAFVPAGQQPPLAGEEAVQVLPLGSTVGSTAAAVAGAGDSNSSSISGFAPEEPRGQQQESIVGCMGDVEMPRPSLDFQISAGVPEGYGEQLEQCNGSAEEPPCTRLSCDGRESLSEPLLCTTSFMPCVGGMGGGVGEGLAMQQQQLELQLPESPIGSLVAAAAASFASRAVSPAPASAAARETATARDRVSAAAAAFGSQGAGAPQLSVAAISSLLMSSPDRSAPSSAAVTPRASTPTAAPHNPFAGMIYTSTRTNRIMPFDPASVSPCGSGRSSSCGGRWMLNGSGGWWAPTKGKSLGGTTAAPNATNDSPGCHQEIGREGEKEQQQQEEELQGGSSSSQQILEGVAASCSEGGLGSVASSAPATPDAGLAPLPRATCDSGASPLQEQQPLERQGTPLSVKCQQRAAAAAGPSRIGGTPKSRSRMAAIAKQQAAFAAAVAAAAVDSPCSATSSTSSSRGTRFSRGPRTSTGTRCKRKGQLAAGTKHGSTKGLDLPNCECEGCSSGAIARGRGRRAGMVGKVALVLAGGVALMAATGPVLSAGTVGGAARGVKMEQQRRGAGRQQQQQQQDKVGQVQGLQKQQEGVELMMHGRLVGQRDSVSVAAAASVGSMQPLASTVPGTFREGGQLVVSPSKGSCRGGASSVGARQSNSHPVIAQPDLKQLEPTLEVLAKARTAALSHAAA